MCLNHISWCGKAEGADLNSESGRAQLSRVSTQQDANIRLAKALSWSNLLVWENRA